MLLASTLVLLLAAGPEATEAPEAPKTTGPALVPCGEITRNPSFHLGREVRLRVQLHSQLASWNPYVTRFGSGTFAAFQVWSDEQMLWSPEEFAAPAVRLFTRRGGAGEKALAQASRYARFEVVAVVQEVFLDRPWIEVRAVVPLEEQVTEGAVIHAGRARQLATARSWKLAQGELERALAGSLPPLARADLERLRSECRRAAEAASTAPATSRKRPPSVKS